MKNTKPDFVIELEIEGKKYFGKKLFELPDGFKLTVRQRDNGKLTEEGIIVSGFSGTDELSVTVDMRGDTRLKRRTKR